MSAQFKAVERVAIVEQCQGCSHVVEGGEGSTCEVYLDPSWKWGIGQCNFATHIKREAAKTQFINPLKLAKMRARGLHH